MSEKTPFWKQPQNYIIAILLLGISGYIGHQQLQPKTNKLAQASAYFDAIDAEERAEAEKKRAAEEKEKARLAAIEMENAKEEARIAIQKAKDAEQRIQIAKNEQKNIQRQAQLQLDANDNNNSNNWMIHQIKNCNRTDDSTHCELVCIDSNGSTKSHWTSISYRSGYYYGYPDPSPGSYRTTTEYYQNACQTL